MAGVAIRAEQGTTIRARALTNAEGRFALVVPGPGAYVVIAQRIGYQEVRATVMINGTEPLTTIEIRLAPPPIALPAVTVTAPAAVDVRTGDQSYQQSVAHVGPSSLPSQLLQQAVAGAARAPTGEVHIHGQHDEFTYYVDGVPIPASIAGSLNEVFAPAVVDRIDVETGGWDAQYGNKNIAVVNVATRIPSGTHYAVSGYDGSFASNGQTVIASTTTGSVGILVSATRQQTDMRREPVMYDPSTLAPINFHNSGQDDFGFGKLEYRPTARDLVTLDVNASTTHFAAPYDSSSGIEDDHEDDANSFVNLAWRRRLGPLTADSGAHELFGALYVRQGGLTYTPGAADQPVFVFYPDTSDRYSVTENRSATTVGVETDYGWPLGSHVAAKAGFNGSLVTGREDFATVDSVGAAGPSAHAPLHGGDAGGYAQTVWTPTSAWALRTGVRFDRHVAPLAGDQQQLSPRVRLSYFPTPNTSVWLYYGRLFVPPNVENLNLLGSGAQAGAAGLPTVPERDNDFEAGVAHRFPGGVLKLDGYARRSSPAIDDNTLPGTAVVATVNIAQVQVNGIETVFDLDPHGPWSGSLNLALNHAQGHGPVTGGFLPSAYPVGWFDLDHDQRLSIVANATYTRVNEFVSVTGIFGSGLTNGNPNAAPNLSGLLDFNPAVKVAPSFIVSASAGVARPLGASTVHVELFSDNLLDLHYILKGAFTSGGSVGRPRSVQLHVRIER